MCDYVKCRLPLKFITKNFLADPITVGDIDQLTLLFTGHKGDLEIWY